MKSKRTRWSLCVIGIVIAAVLLLGMRQNELEFCAGFVYGSHMENRLQDHTIRDGGILMNNDLPTVCQRQVTSHTQRTAAVLLPAVLLLLSQMVLCMGSLYLKVFIFSPLRYLFDLSVLQRKDGKKRAVPGLI